MIAIHLPSLLLFFSISTLVAGHKPASANEPESVKIFALAYPIVAYILESEKNVATTYLVACPKSLPTASCPFNQPYTLIEGPKTAKWSYVASAQRLTVDCTLKGTTSMGCRATGRAGAAGPMTTEAYTWKGEKASTLFRDVELITNTKSLMTHTVTLSTVSLDTFTKETVETKTVVGVKSATTSTPVSTSPNTDLMDAIFTESTNSILSTSATSATSRPSSTTRTVSTPSPTATANSGLTVPHSSLRYTSATVMFTMLAILGL